ncbi:MAG TPA: polysaccharide biosynthesis/export family protein [Blastocatellia bacterium]|nr:polysaccharide biosynthesis/export family protein [Blastocatellia bacterium]
MSSSVKKSARTSMTLLLLLSASVFAQSGVSRVTEGTSSPSDEEAAIQAQINSIYQSFLNSYRLGPGDVLAVHVDKHQEDSLERGVVSPTGHLYYPLLGTIAVAGKTLPQLQLLFTTSIAEFIRDPRVSVNLLEANSAKIAVLGDVRLPGVVVMGRPMRVLDAIAAVGGIAETGDGSKISLLRQSEDGRVQLLSVNINNVLKGKSGPEGNPVLRAGDTIVVHGNLFKKVGKISSLMGIGSFIAFLANGGN